MLPYNYETVHETTELDAKCKYRLIFQSFAVVNFEPKRVGLETYKGDHLPGR